MPNERERELINFMILLKHDKISPEQIADFILDREKYLAKEIVAPLEDITQLPIVRIANSRAISSKIINGGGK